MSMTMMLSGTLAKQPEQRTSSRGNADTTATLRTGEGNDAVFASVTAFGDLACILAVLDKGDPMTVVGSGRLSIYTPAHGGDPRASLSVTASRIVCLTDRQAAPIPGATDSGEYEVLPSLPYKACPQSRPITTPSLFKVITHAEIHPCVEIQCHPTPGRTRTLRSG